jgi:2-C-methyl-D-erythritol 2,4-cyclodiphosphate synthase
LHIVKNGTLFTKNSANSENSENSKETMFKIGFGNDIHRLEANHPLILGGVKIPSEKGSVGHSDADALTHAVTDAILGALALGDIGSHFSDKDEKWKDADSFVFLSEAVQMMKEKNFKVENIDSTISLEKLKLRPFIDEMRKNLARVLETDIDCISVKAKTGEKLDSIGEGKAIKVEAVILLSKQV